MHDDDVDVEIGSEHRPTSSPTFQEIVAARASRRGFMKGMLLAGGVALAPKALRGLGGSPVQASDGATAVAPGTVPTVSGSTGLTFDPIAPTSADAIVVPEGYTSDIVVRWGDNILPGFDPGLDTSQIAGGVLLQPGAAARQRRQFGYNCDAVEYYPLPDAGDTRRAVVCVNHEYTNDDMLFPGWGDEITYVDPDTSELVEGREAFVRTYPESVHVAKACHGISVVEIEQGPDGTWTHDRQSWFNRRIHADTPIQLVGPAAGDELLRTAADPSGTSVLGTLNNCAAGRTPWGTYLSAEENFDQYFGQFDEYANSPDADPKILAMHARIPLPGGDSARGWEFIDERFDISKHPTEAFRFGWVVEVDPYDRGPNKGTPKKRTAIGRFKHECATAIAAPGGQCVIYSGDDARFEYMYKFVTAGTISSERERNLDLLDEGTLYVAKLNEDGTGEWLPLVHGQNGLTAANGFDDQNDVLVNARGAADVLGATPMDRPEDFEANPVTHRVYCALTNNSRRTYEPEIVQANGRDVQGFPNQGNPRGDNDYGQILEIIEDGDDNAATAFTWNIFVMAGDPLDGAGSYLTSMEDLDDYPLQREDTYFAGYPVPADLSSFGSPDNLGFDSKGNIWIVTDGSQPTGTNNGAFAAPTQGPERGKVMQFLSGPVDSEVCGSTFTPDDTSYFVNIQHPGDGGGVGEETSDWPDGGGLPPRPSLVAVRREDGGVVGT